MKLVKRHLRSSKNKVDIESLINEGINKDVNKFKGINKLLKKGRMKYKLMK